MKNNFASEYTQEVAIKAQYHAATDEQGREAARAAYAAHKARIEAKGIGYARLYHLFAEAQEQGNERIDLHDAIWDSRVKPLIDSLREFGIEEFTFSSTWSSAVETAWLFLQNGCSLQGLIQINGQSNTFSGEPDKIPAYLFRLQ